jgi:ParB family chromosome partitioning protein
MGRPREYASNAARQRAYRKRRKRNARLSRNSDEWYTPPEYLALARRVMGGIDLDPASCAEAQRTVKARRWYDKQTDGLAQEWRGRCWLNPPYSHPLVAKFTEKLRLEFSDGRVGAAICVVNNATDTEWFQALLASFPSCFTKRIRFYRTDGRAAESPRLGQVFFYLGPDGEKFAEVFRDVGVICSPVPA